MGRGDVAYAGAVRDLAFFSALDGGFCLALADGLIFWSYAGWRMVPGIRAWSPARRAAAGTVLSL